MTAERTLVISPSCFPGTTGDSANYLEMIEGLMRLGVKIVLVCPKHSDSNSFDEEMRRQGATIIRIPLSPPRLAEVGERQIVLSTVLKLVTFYVMDFFTAAAVLLESGTKHVIVRHCIHTMNLPPLLGILERILGIKSIADADLLSSSASIGVIHTPKPLLRILAFYEKTAIRFYTRFLALTPSQIDRITDFGFPRSRVILRSVGINTRRIPVYSLKDIPKNTFGCFGTLEKWGNVDFLLKAWAKVMERKLDAKLFIIGDGSMRSYLKKLANDLRIEESTVFLDGVPMEVLWTEYFKLFRVAIIPRSAKFYPENASMKLIEAIASGKPVVASRVLGITNVVNEGDGIVFAEPDNGESLALAISGLLGNDEAILALSEKALKASQRFSVDSQLKELSGILAGNNPDTPR
jgi:glycosyltransferase involved in cell wall biosynthesis